MSVVFDPLGPHRLWLTRLLSMGFSRQEYQSGLPCPPPEDLPDPGIGPVSLLSPALAGRFFTTSVTWKLQFFYLFIALHSMWDLVPQPVVEFVPLHWWRRVFITGPPGSPGSPDHPSRWLLLVENPPANAGDIRDTGLIPGKILWRRA